MKNLRLHVLQKPPGVRDGFIFKLTSDLQRRKAKSSVSLGGNLKIDFVVLCSTVL